MRVGTKLAVMTGTTILVLGIVGVSSYFSIQDLVSSNRLVVHTMQVIDKLQAVSAGMAHTASAQRTYIITGNYQYLASYQSYVQDTQEAVADLKQLIKDNIEQAKRAERLEAQVKDRLDSLEITLNAFQTKGQDAAFDFIKRGKGQLYIIHVLELISEMREHEQDLLAHRTEDMLRSADNAKLIILTGSLLVMAILSFFNYFFGQSVLSCVKILRRTAANIERGRYDTAASIDSQDEFHDIAEAFNTLGMLLEAKVDELKQEQVALDSIEVGLSELRKKLDDTGLAMEACNQQASASLKAIENIGRSAARSCADLMAGLESVVQRETRTNQNSSQLCDQMEELYRVSATLETLTTELSVVALAISMEASKEKEPNRAMIPVAEKLTKLSQGSREETINVEKSVTGLMNIATRVKTANEESLAAVRTSQHVLTRLTEELYSANENLAQTKVHTDELLTLSSNFAHGLSTSRTQLNELTAQALKRKQEMAGMVDNALQPLIEEKA